MDKGYIKHCDIIRTVGTSNDEILGNIIKLYVPSGRFDVDPTFGFGGFYKSGKILTPNFVSDISPKAHTMDISTVKQYDCRHLPFVNNEIDSIVFDPPFSFGTDKVNKYEKSKSLGFAGTFEHLQSLYTESLQEFYRILRKKGVLVFKICDQTRTRVTFTHCLIYNWAMQAGFKPLDLFVLIRNHAICDWKRQHHARKFHCFFLVFQK